MTISIERLKRVKTVVVHEGCPDGIASAILVHDALPEAEIVFCQYGTAKRREMPATEGLLFVDFTPEPSRNQEFVDAGAIVLDHHKGAAEFVAAFGENGVFADEGLEPGVSGAVLAYRHVWEPRIREFYHSEHPVFDSALTFATIAGVRDTWQTTHPWWAASCAQAEALRFWPVADWLRIRKPFESRTDLWSMLEIGKVLTTKRAESVAHALDRAWCTTTEKGTRLCIFEGITLTSDAAEVVGETSDLIIGFGYEFEAGEHKLIFSTRSHTTFDCSALARRFGGGGHTRAAGFSVRFDANNPSEVPDEAWVAHDNPYSAAEELVDWFEQGMRSDVMPVKEPRCEIRHQDGSNSAPVQCELPKGHPRAEHQARGIVWRAHR